MAKTENDQPAYYVDSSVFCDLIGCPPEEEPAKSIAQIIEDAENNKCRLITSTFTMTEVLRAKHEKDQTLFDKDVQARIDRLWHPVSSPIELIDAHELIMRKAAERFRSLWETHKWANAKGPDMIHLVTAERAGVDEFFTTDKKLTRYSGEFGFGICPPHRPPVPVEEEKEGEENDAPLFSQADDSENDDAKVEETNPEKAEDPGAGAGDTESGRGDVGGGDEARPREAEAGPVAGDGQEGEAKEG